MKVVLLTLSLFIALLCGCLPAQTITVTTTEVTTTNTPSTTTTESLYDSYMKQVEIYQGKARNELSAANMFKSNGQTNNYEVAMMNYNLYISMAQDFQMKALKELENN